MGQTERCFVLRSDPSFRTRTCSVGNQSRGELFWASAIGGAMLNILFVCTGNVCRSPTAERLVCAGAIERKIDGVSASSAGLRAVVGHPMHPTAALVLESLGGDASNFAARQFTPAIGANADLVLTMTIAQRDDVLERAPRLLRRTFSLAEAAWLASANDCARVEDLSEMRFMTGAAALAEVDDPIGQNADVFERVGAQIADLLRPVLALLQRSQAL